jgi:hypothetical protein
MAVTGSTPTRPNCSSHADNRHMHHMQGHGNNMCRRRSCGETQGTCGSDHSKAGRCNMHNLSSVLQHAQPSNRVCCCSGMVHAWMGPCRQACLPRCAASACSCHQCIRVQTIHFGQQVLTPCMPVALSCDARSVCASLLRSIVHGQG